MEAAGSSSLQGVDSSWENMLKDLDVRRQDTSFRQQEVPPMSAARETRGVQERAPAFSSNMSGAVAPVRETFNRQQELMPLAYGQQQQQQQQRPMGMNVAPQWNPSPMSAPTWAQMAARSSQWPQPHGAYVNEAASTYRGPISNPAIYPSGSAQTDPSSIQPFACQQMKLVSWSLLQLLIRIFESDNTQPEVVLDASRSNKGRYYYSMISMSMLMERCMSGEDRAIGLMHHTLVSPFLETFQQHFSTYCQKLPIPPSSIEVQGGRSDWYQLHNFFSAVYYFFCPRIFAHNITPIHVTTSLAEDYIITILSTLFEMAPGIGSDRELTNDVLFTKLNESIDLLKSMRADAFIRDKAEDKEYVTKSLIANALLDVLRKAAVKALYSQIRAIPRIMSNRVVQLQLDSLSHSL